MANSTKLLIAFHLNVYFSFFFEKWMFCSDFDAEGL